MYVNVYNVKTRKNRGVEQQVARRAHNPEVAGSNPAPATMKTQESLKKGSFFLVCPAWVLSITNLSFKYQKHQAEYRFM
jgi:hypothetical protein